MTPLIIKLFIKVREAHHRLSRGQTMTEYALILAAVGIAVFIAYSSTGSAIENMVSWTSIDQDLLGS